MSVTLERSALDALFVHYEGQIGESRGGVQICSQEYFEALQAGGFRLRTVEVARDRRLSTRLRLRLDPRPYRDRFVLDQALRAVGEALTAEVRCVFLNHADLRPLAAPLRARAGHARPLVLLSHGLSSVDYLHALDARSSPPSRRDLARLGGALLAESGHSRHLDHVFCMTPCEAEIERWLGARSVAWLPRRIDGLPLEWRPEAGTVGYAGRLDHPPNHEGLVLLLEALETTASRLTVRVVGAPEAAGQALARRFPIVRYLGTMSEAALRAEASRWCCYVQPVFRHSMGASMKLAIAIGWEIPIATTTMGRRGYAWKDGNLPIADTPQSLAGLTLELSSLERAAAARRDVSRIRRSSPTTEELGELVRTALGRILESALQSAASGGAR